MAITQPGYTKGSVKLATTHNFLGTNSQLKPEKDDELVYRYGRGRISYLMEIFKDMKKPSGNMKFSHFEQDRTHPKIKATCSAGSANAGVTFTLDSSSIFTQNNNNTPYPSASTSTSKGIPVREGMEIQIKPSSGSINAGTYVNAIVYSVDASAGTFVAYPAGTGESIPAISSADEIIVVGMANGEGANVPDAMQTTKTEYSNQISIWMDKWEISGIAACEKRWFKVNGSEYAWASPQETEAYIRFLNLRELGFLYGKELTNTTLFDLYANAGTPIVKNKGMIPSILDDGNTYNYNSISGLTLSDMEDIVVVLDKQKGAKNNWMFNGLQLDIRLDRELRDILKNGAITYGNYTMSEEKAVNLGFKSFKISSYNFEKAVCDPFNDLQVGGASGYTYPSEGMIIPKDTYLDPDEGRVPVMRMRYLQKGGTESQEMIVEPFNGRSQGDNGQDKFEARYYSYTGLEYFALNRWMYIKQS